MMTYHKLFLNISPTRSQNISSNFTNKISEYFANKISEYFTKFHQQDFWIFHQQDLWILHQQYLSEYSTKFHQPNKTAYSGKLLKTFTLVTEKPIWKSSKPLPPNHEILFPFPQNCCSKTMLFSLQSPTSSTLHRLLILYRQTSCQTPAQKNLPWSWKLTEKLPSNLRTTIYVQNVVLERQNNTHASTNTVTPTSTL